MSTGRVLVTGSAGFIGGYVVEELLGRDYEVVGVDDHSKYGPVRKSYDDHPGYTLVEGDARDVGLLGELLGDCDHMIAGAAMIGGISYFHTFAYDLLATNERIMAASCDAAIGAHKGAKLQKVTYLSSSMVYESAPSWPSYEGQELEIPPPLSSYGFQKLAVEYYARAALQQHGLPYTIVRPFNCVGTGEMRALSDVEVASGNVKLAMSHVVPDLVQKIVKGQDPLHLLGDGTQVRHYTYAGDLARGIVTAMEHPAALNDDFNLSTAQSTTVMELAENLWRRLRGDAPFRTVSDPPFEHDVQKRVPSTDKARAVLGFEATTTLDEMLDEVVPWVVDAVGRGLIQPMTDNRKFWRVLLVIVLGALALRVGYVMLAKRTEPVLGDQIYYNAQANTIARGHGFTDFRDGSQQAEHPPLTALVLTPTSWVMERFDPGGSHLLAQRLTMTVFGAGVVLVIGLIGRAVAGSRAGLVAAGIAAIYPNLWINDGLVMSETLATLAVALAILLAYRFIRAPRAATALWVGVACGLAMLARAELGLLLPLMVLPVALFLKQFACKRQVGLFLLACVAALGVVSPWLVANLTRFDEPVLFSTNDGLTICGANLHRTYYGEGTGLWALDCATLPVPKGDRSVVSNALRRDGLRFIRDHLGRVPVVVGVRVARVWSLYAPGLMANYNVNEGRDVEVSWAGFVAFWILVPCAVVGGIQLRRRRVQITPLVSQFVIVTITAAAIYGITRFRAPAEVSLVVLAAVAVDHWWRRPAESDSRPVAVEASA